MDDIFKNRDENLPAFFCYIGNVCGFMSSLIWFIVLLPQIYKNYQRKEVDGISNTWATMNFFASLINTIFIFSSNNIPIFSKVSASYMPVLEYLFILQIFYYHKSEKSIKINYFLLFSLGICVLSGILIYLALEVEDSLNYIEWGAIFLWSFESFPQISLNFKLSSVEALSTTMQLLTFIGKTCDILSNYLLIIPFQYRYLGFFSTTNAYIGIIQVIFYYRKPKINENNENIPLKTQPNHKNTNMKSLKFCLILAVSVFCMGTAFGFWYRADHYYISIPLIICNYLIVLLMFFYWKNKNINKGNSFTPLEN